MTTREASKIIKGELGSEVILHVRRHGYKKKLAFNPSEQPVIAQIFGKNTETFIRATKICEDMGFTGIDINMGCPAKKVVPKFIITP